MKITLKDNVVAEVNKGTTVYSVISGISESLAKSAICGKINGVLVDLNAEIGRNCKLEIITQKGCYKCFMAFFFSYLSASS